MDSKLVTKSGLVLIHDSVNDDCKFSKKLNEKESWHVAKYDELNLSAQVSDLDVESVEQYRSKYSSFWNLWTGLGIGNNWLLYFTTH